MPLHDFVDDCLDQLRALPPVLEIAVQDEDDPREGTRAGDPRFLLITLETGVEGRRYELLALPMERPTRASIASASTQLLETSARWERESDISVVPVILAPHLGRELIQHTSTLGIGCVDTVGNAYLALDTAHYIHVEGRPARRAPKTPKVIRAAGYRVLFSLMAKPFLLRAPLRSVAEEAETSVTAVQDMRRWLAAQRYTIETSQGTTWNPATTTQLRNLWLAGYQTVLRPSLLIGELELGWHPSKLKDTRTRENEIEAKLHAAGHDFTCWRWGGASAAFRVTGHYGHSEVSTLHIDLKCFSDTGGTLRELAVELGARPARNGTVQILNILNPSAMNDKDERPGCENDGPEWHDVVDPLLVWAETMLSTDPRAREGAHELLRYTRLDASAL